MKTGDRVKPTAETLQRAEFVPEKPGRYVFDESTRALVLSVGPDDSMLVLLLDTFSNVTTLQDRWEPSND